MYAKGYSHQYNRTELREERAKVKYRDQDILRLTATVNQSQQSLAKYEEQNHYLKEKSGIIDVESVVEHSKARLKLKEQLETERLRSLNAQVCVSFHLYFYFSRFLSNKKITVRV